MRFDCSLKKKKKNCFCLLFWYNFFSVINMGKKKDGKFLGLEGKDSIFNLGIYGWTFLFIIFFCC